MQTLKDLKEHLKQKPPNNLIRLEVNGKAIWKTPAEILRDVEHCDPESEMKFKEVTS